MTDQDAKKADERDEDELEDDEEEEVESEPKPAPKAKAVASKSSGSAAKAAPKTGGVPSAQVGVFVVLALVAGGAAGWFGHIQQAKAALMADSSAPTTESGPCGSWQQKICGSAGKQSAACQQAKGAADLLTPHTCEAGLLAMPATLAKVKAARSSCDKLVTKLCADLPPDSQTCGMVKERTPSFPPQRCEEMLAHYDEVIGQLKQIDQTQGGMQMGAPGGPGPGPVVASPH